MRPKGSADLLDSVNLIWPTLIILLAHRLVNHFPDPGRSEVLRRPKGDAFRTQRRPGSGKISKTSRPAQKSSRQHCLGTTIANSVDP